MSKSGGFQFSDASQRYLPFVVVGSVAGTTSWFVLPGPVYAEIGWVIVLLVAVHVIHILLRRQRTPQQFRHDPTMFGYPIALTPHCIEQGYVLIGDSRKTKLHVSLTSDSPSVSSFVTPTVIGASTAVGKVGGLTGFASSVKGVLFHPRTQSGHWIPANRVTRRTPNLLTRLTGAVHDHENRLPLNRRMIERSQIRWASHALHPSVRGVPAHV